MSNFYKLWEQMEDNKDSQDDGAIENCIRAGLNISEDFWDNFMQILGNEGLEQLLDCSKDTISTWSQKITSALEKVKNSDDESQSKNTTIPTEQPTLPQNVSDPSTHNVDDAAETNW